MTGFYKCILISPPWLFFKNLIFILLIIVCFIYNNFLFFYWITLFQVFFYQILSLFFYCFCKFLLLIFFLPILSFEIKMVENYIFLLNSSQRFYGRWLLEVILSLRGLTWFLSSLLGFLFLDRCFLIFIIFLVFLLFYSIWFYYLALYNILFFQSSHNSFYYNLLCIGSFSF